MGWGYLLILISALGRTEDLYPHPGVRYVYEETPVYSSDGKKQIGAISPHGALVPCTVVKDGAPLFGPKGEILVGFTEQVFEEPQASSPGHELTKIVQAFQDVANSRRQRLSKLESSKARYNGKRVGTNDCQGTVLGSVPLSALSPNEMRVMYPPPPSTTDALVDIINKIESINKKLQNCDCLYTTDTSDLIKLLVEFHNSVYCLSSELQVGGRKKAFLKAWDIFIDAKLKSNPGLKDDLRMAKEIDLAARTALYEGDHNRGCSGKGLCEKDIVLLSIRNRARTKPCSNYGCKFEGDIGGVATRESQYNIWSDFFTDITYMSSCFLRIDRHPSTPSERQAQWINEEQKQSYHRMVKMFQTTIQRAEEILYADDEKISASFGGVDIKNLTGLRHYYHPPAMQTCYPQFPQRQFVSEAYVRCGQNYHFIRKENIEVTGKGPDGNVLFSILKKDDSGTSDPIDDNLKFENVFPGCILDPSRIKPPTEASRCSLYGLPPSKGKKSTECAPLTTQYFRTYPKWIQGAETPEITCKQVPSKGESCNDSVQHVDATWGGSCDRQMMPALGVI